MSSLKYRVDGDVITSSDFEEDDEEEEEIDLQDETTDEGSDSETNQLLKQSNGSARKSRGVPSHPETEMNGVPRVHSIQTDLIDPESRTGVVIKNGTAVRNGGSVLINIPSTGSLPNGDAIPLEATDIHRYRTKDRAEAVNRKLNPYPRELKKVAVAALFVFCNFLATGASLAVVHEYYPLIEPLPDRILDSFPFQPWALSVSEVLLTIHTTLAILVILFHKHRFIVVRRIFLVLGLLYGYRAITMFVTVLPRSDNTYYCSPKLADEGKALTFYVIVERVFTILSGFGLSINGKHTFCGDYIFSGHTSMFVMTYLVIQEYTSRRYFIFQWMMCLSGVFGVTFLLWARGHYTIDCIIAYYVTTRIWYIYHSMACHPALKKSTSANYFTRIWWWGLFRWFEENVRSGPIPNGFSLPISRKFSKCLRSKSRELVNETSRLTRRSRAKISKQEA